MANNLANQTYKIKEWIIVDDYKTDRSKIAQKYAKKYNLNIKYIRGDKALGRYKRKCGLVRANNLGWQASKGDLLVWLQDFIIIPNNGIESLVDVHRRHPNALVTPVDIYYFSQPINKKNKEDWWDGETNIIDKESWRNVRVKFRGLFRTENPFNFEMNYAMTPKKIIDDLNGWWEFFDEGLGFDNTEIAYRALHKGYDIIIDDANIAKCIDLWKHIGGEKQNITDRERMLNTPRWVWFKRQKLDPVRDEKLDHSITQHFEVPKEITNKECADWINAHAEVIADQWE